MDLERLLKGELRKFLHTFFQQLLPSGLEKTQTSKIQGPENAGTGL
jgi:hypothetical protein